VLSIDATNSNGDTPLMFAMGGGHLGVAAELLNVSVTPQHTPARLTLQQQQQREADMN
jgi:ankyrin repeat protein